MQQKEVNIFPGVWRVDSNSSTPYMMMHEATSREDATRKIVIIRHTRMCFIMSIQMRTFVKKL